MSDTVRIIIDIILALIGTSGIVSILMLRAQKQKLIADAEKTKADAGKSKADAEKTGAETDQVRLDSMMRMIDRLDERLKQSEQENADLRSEVCTMRSKIETLQNQVKELRDADSLKEKQKQQLDRHVRELIRVSVALVKQMKRLEITPDVQLPEWIQEYEESKHDD